MTVLCELLFSGLGGFCFFFFFQAEDGIRDWSVTGVQTCALPIFFIGGLVYKFANFREEGRVRLLIEAIRNAQYDVAYQNWDADARYTMNDFLQDWGKDGYYTKGMHDARVTDSSGKGSSVVVYVTIDSLKYPVALRVDKETLKISFSPISKYPSP